jgi:DNA-binding response OmpR family regulator
MAYKLIIAHDSPSIQKSIQMAFPASEFEVIVFKDGTETVKALSQLEPDAVLLSLSLPQKDGYEVGRFLKSREEFKQTPLFLLKGAFEPLDAERIIGLKYDEIVEEPFDSERLARVVRETIEGKRDPQTLPEEPLFDEIHITKNDIDPKHKKFARETHSPDLRQKQEKHPFVVSEELGSGTEEKLRGIVKEEILEVVRELEKRLKTQVSVEIKEWIEQELKKIRKLLKAGD